ncbi:two-component system response regulator BtsR [Ferrimonas senticii]|uniref:two-component system response regulator BtsR n=1 Tax=Ferrimonas senticii TaxID=394566 RepID=UPI0003F53B0C|nr:two-component system response regulator BtsR [Ferrimonas senticii]
MTIRTLIIDDEPLARQELALLLSEHHDIEVVAEAGNAIEGFSQIQQYKPQLVFIDIQMPKITGMELVSMLDPAQMPFVVFVTAYDQYAIDAFSNNASDYLLKPVAAERLAKTLAKIRAASAPQTLRAVEPLTHLPCYAGKRLKIIDVAQTEYIFSDLTGVHVATAQGTFFTQLTLKVLEQQSDFLRCHRQYLVRPQAVAEIVLQESGNAEVVTHSGASVPVSRRYLKPLKQKFGFA